MSSKYVGGAWVSSSDPLDVAVSGSGNSADVTATPVLTISNTYATNDYVGTSNTPITFANAARAVGGHGFVENAVLISGDVQTVAGELWLFDTAPAGLPADSAAFTISDADAAHCIGVIPFSTFYASALNSVSVGVPAAHLFFKCASDSTSLYGAFVTRGSPSYTSLLLTFRLGIL